jgi:DNA-directed RNA polymerase subunit RPC12/RpoP
MIRDSINIRNTDWYRCIKCGCSFFVKSNDPDKGLLKRSMRCPNYVRCKGRIIRKSWANAGEIRNFRWVRAKELYQACAGLGLESERDCSPETLRRLLHGNRVVATELQDTGDPKKAILLSLTLNTGKTIHLSSSVKGAIIYKVTEAGYGG